METDMSFVTRYDLFLGHNRTDAPVKENRR